jgi:hypothetical protein
MDFQSVQELPDGLEVHLTSSIFTATLGHVKQDAARALPLQHRLPFTPPGQYIVGCP